MKQVSIRQRLNRVTHLIQVVDELYELAVLVTGNEQGADAYFRRIAKPLLDGGLKTGLSVAVSKAVAINMLALQATGFKHESALTQVFVQDVLDAFSALFTTPLHTNTAVH
ncbi:hypothetical protein ACIGCM_01315 [Pseudomonas sp. NPDC078700]|uniref:hypothetical protein n=1 Tax=Pseudomonas sp. NPDC078700 TaxID=3364424 RepID=UPI0037CA9800